MAQIAGKYVMTNIADFENFLKKEGVPDDKIREVTKGDQYLEFKVDGSKISINEHHGNKDSVTNVVLGKEVEDKKEWGTFKTTAKLDGNILTLDSKTTDGKTRTKSFTFDGDQVEMKRASRDGASVVKITFKKA